MATYAELLQAYEDEGLRRKVRVALVVAADIIRTEANGVQNHSNRMKWARTVYASPQDSVPAIMWAVLAQNRTASLAAILGASDDAVQTAVNAAVDILAQG